MADKDDREFLHRLRSLTSKLWASFNGRSCWSGDACITDVAVASVVSGLSFPACLSALQTFIFGPSRLTSNRPFAAPICGFLSVFLSGSMASAMFVSCVALCAGRERFFELHAPKTTANTEFRLEFEPTDVTVSGVLSLALFRLLGGRFRSVLPSHLAHPGAFARISLPAPGRHYASESAKRELARIGTEYPRPADDNTGIS